MLSERFQCPRCEKHFGHQQILQLHLRVHESNGDSQLKTSQEENGAVKSGQMNKMSNCTQTTNERIQSSPSCKICHFWLNLTQSLNL
jgi:hypothetical protein